MEIRQHEVVVFRTNDYLISLEKNQDSEKIRLYNKKTARVLRSEIEEQTEAEFYTIRFPDGFIIKSVAISHLSPIRGMNKYKGHRPR